MADANVSVSFSASTNDFVSQVSEARDALQTFAAPFGEINRQLASFGSAASQAFSADRLTALSRRALGDPIASAVVRRR